MNHALRFLSNGDKVRAVVRFRGRQVTHDNLGRDMLDKFCEAVSELGTPDRKTRLEGRFLSVTISPVKNTAEEGRKD